MHSKQRNTLSLVFPILFILATSLSSQEISTGINPGIKGVIPIGSWAEDNLSDFGLGGEINGIMGFPLPDYLSAGVNGGYLYVPARANLNGLSGDINLSLLNLGLSIRSDLALGDRFSLFGRLDGSGYYAMLTGDSALTAPGISWGAGGGASLLLNNRLQLEALVTYDSYLGLIDAVGFTLGLTTRVSGQGTRSIPRRNYIPVRPGVPGGGFIELLDGELDRVFPVLYKYYDSHPIGSVRIKNSSRKSIKNVELRLIVNEYMGTPKLSGRIDHLKAGEEQDVEIYALFTEDILSITEGAKLSSELKADYLVDGIRQSDSVTLTLNTYDRNAIMWDDDRKIAAFITARDEEIQKLSRNVASLVRDSGLEGFSNEFQLGMALFCALEAYGCAYVVDPSSSYLELSGESAVDAVQFPRQTIQYRAGDCDDLTAAFTALLESVGVETAFITVPGHIFSAFRVDMSPEEARKVFSNNSDLIILDGGVWIPVETTALTGGFMNAWSLGARQWRKNIGEGRAALYPTREAWEYYEPVAFSVSSYEIEIPDRYKTEALFSYEMDEYVKNEISSRERVLLARLNRNPGDYPARNALGVLYSRFGMEGEGQAHFIEAADGGYIPAMVNLGNGYYLKEDYGRAEAEYARALDTRTDYPAALLGMARSAYAREDYEKASGQFEILKQISPSLATRFAYLGEGDSDSNRASQTALTGHFVLWDEEE